MKRAFSVASSVAFLAFAASSQAIVWRHDIPESQVLALGNDTRFQGIGKVNVPGGFGTGTFIGFGTGNQPWGLSAKHVITTGQTGTFTFENGASFSIVQAIGIAGTDVSVFRMGSFTAGVFTPGLNNSATIAPGTLIDGAGYGGHGAQGTMGGNWLYDNKRRGMQSRVDGMENINFGGEVFMSIRDRFLAPGDPNVRPTQGFGAPGDSGHALFDPGNNIIAVLSGGEFETYGNRNWYAMITPAVRTQIIALTGVPEPATMAALGLGLFAMARKRRQKRTS